MIDDGSKSDFHLRNDANHSWVIATINYTLHTTNSVAIVDVGNNCIHFLHLTLYYML